MKLTFFTIFIIVAFFITGCSHQQLFLKNAVTLVLSNKKEKIAIRNQDQLFIEWSYNDRLFSTVALTQECKKGVCKSIETPITVNIVEINRDDIRIGCHAWKSLNDLPARYLEPNSRMRILDSKHPTLIIPLETVKNIYLYNRIFTKDDFFESPKYMIIGAGLGALTFAGITVESAISEKETFGYSDLDINDILTSGLAGALIGSVVYPAYKFLHISFGKGTGKEIMKYSKRYPVNQFGTGYKMDIMTSKKPPPELIEGLSYYRQNKLEKARSFFELAVEQDQQNTDAYAYLAESYRRLHQIDKAVSTAQKAVKIEPCHSFAHTVLAWAYNPMYGSWDGANSDTTWHHLLKAVECDSMDGNIWIGVWVEAIRRGEIAMEKRALRLLIKTGFLTSPLLAYNQWMLRHLPENAILLTNGDWDTYPAVALQEVEHFRPDVVIVNLSLLNTTWYQRFLRDRYSLPLPFRNSELDSLSHFMNENGNLVLVASQIVRGWLNLYRKGSFPHPIAIAINVGNLDFALDTQDHLQLSGAFRLWLPHPTETLKDTATMRISLTEINPEDFAGSFVCSEDRSPVRITSSNRLVTNISAMYLQYTQALIESGRFSEATKMIAIVEQFEKQTKWGPVFTEEIEELKKSVEMRSN